MNPLFSFSLQQTTQIRFKSQIVKTYKKNSTVSIKITEIESKRLKLRKCEPDLIQSSDSGFEIGEIGIGSGGSHW
jgi:hydrogenase maturation factor HypE